MSYPLVRLDECTRIVSGATPSTNKKEYWDGHIRWVTPADLSNLEGSFISETPRTITEAGLASCAAELLPAYSVLFSSRAPIGHVAINTEPMATNQGFKSFVPSPSRLNAQYLYHWLRANRAYLESQGNGATFKEVSKAVVARIEIPLPPLGEQRRIAAILDQADDLRRKRRESLSRLEGIYFAIFVEMFGYPIANPMGWPADNRLGNVADIVSGITKGRKLNGATTRVVPYLAVVNVQDRALNLETVKTIEATENEIRRYRLFKDDLVLTEGGDPDKLGRGALWQDEIADCIHQNHIFRVRLDREMANPIFINWLIGGPRGKAYFLRSAKQTTGIASINMTQLREFPLILPPLDLQRAFAARVAEIDKLKARHRAHLAKLDALFGSLQHRAFRGEL